LAGSSRPGTVMVTGEPLTLIRSACNQNGACSQQLHWGSLSSSGCQLAHGRAAAGPWSRIGYFVGGWFA
jgi:hypothetical protein